MLTTTGEPSNLFKALSDKCWKEAMDIEFDALIKNNNMVWIMRKNLALLSSQQP
jgi:hypothetical protein